MVLDSLKKHDLLLELESFEFTASLKKYQTSIKPGRYKITSNMSNTELINKLRIGAQDPVRLVIFGIRKKEDIAGKLSKKFPVDSAEILNLLNDNTFLNNLGFNTENVLAMFIPNTYDIFWNTSAKKILERFSVEFKFFWSATRRSKAMALDMSPIEIITLASIVQSETNMPQDKPMIAGVYINRLKQGIPLEADPTLVWALNDFTIKRVLNVHKEIESPYNTYKYKGLPPGPITIPTPETIDAVINYTKHEYIYFCAREDFSGYSNFAKTYNEHLLNARKYQKALNERGIMK
jgi:UPF0755 protein